MTPGPSLLSLAQVSKGFPGPGGLRPVLADVSFDVPEGDIVCLLGLNGAGKTTLLKIVSALLAPDGGRVLLSGLDVHRRPAEAKARIGFASSEDHSFYGRLSVRMNLWFYAQLHGLPPARWRDRLESLSGQLELSGFLDQPFRELSSGQKQRVLLARALLHDPALVLLDEPHQNLDPGFSTRLRSLLRDEWRGREKRTLLVSTHHLDEAQRISDRWVVLHDGRALFQGSLSGRLQREPGLTAHDFFRNLTSPAAA
ncbi:MAG: ABC transporter ATP-binding protein [Elusimicrobiota bacterium]